MLIYWTSIINEELIFDLLHRYYNYYEDNNLVLIYWTGITDEDHNFVLIYGSGITKKNATLCQFTAPALPMKINCSKSAENVDRR